MPDDAASPPADRSWMDAPLRHAYERQGDGHQFPDRCWWCGQGREAHRTERVLTRWREDGSPVWETREIEGQVNVDD